MEATTEELFFEDSVGGKNFFRKRRRRVNKQLLLVVRGQPASSRAGRCCWKGGPVCVTKGLVGWYQRRQNARRCR